MTLAFKCALTGALAEGAGNRTFDVDVNERLMLRVIPLERIDKDHIAQGTLSDEGRHIVEAALKAIGSKADAKAAKK